MIDIFHYKPHDTGTEDYYTSSEGGISHTGLNSARDCIDQYHLDGEVFETGKPPIRCDYLLLNRSRKKAFFIELKGSGDVKKAIKQLETSRSEIEPSISTYELHYSIVFGADPPRTMKSDLRKWLNKNNGRAKAEPSPMHESIN